MKSLYFALACSLLLSACATGPAAPPLMDVKTVTVVKEVPVSCVKPEDIPQPAQPLQNDKDLLAGSGSQVFDNVWLDHTVRKDWDTALLGVVQACSKLPAQPAAVQ